MLSSAQDKMENFLKPGRQFTSNPTEAETQWLRKANKLLAKHNITRSMKVPKHVVFPPYPKNNTADAASINFDHFEQLMHDADDALGITSTHRKTPTIPKSMSSPKKTTKTTKPLIAAASPVTAAAAPLRSRSLEEVSAAPVAPTAGVTFKSMDLRDASEHKIYDTGASYQENMKHCWDKKKHSITFIPKSQNFHGKTRRSIYERYTISERSMRQLRDYLNDSSKNVSMRYDKSATLEFLNGKTMNLETDLFVHSDEELIETISSILSSTYPQHHFEQIY